VSEKISRLTINDASTVPHPIIPISDFDKFFLNNPLIKNPINGNKGTK
jgi:hypothetical protein